VCEPNSNVRVNEEDSQITFTSHIAFFAMKQRSPYDSLGLPPDAGEDDIKRSFRRLALKLHPDKQTGTSEEREIAERQFKEVNAAYSVLSDPERRQRYDQTGRLNDDDDDDDDERFSSSSRRRAGGSSAAADSSMYMSIDELMSLTFGTRRRRYALLSEDRLILLVLFNLPALVILFAGASAPSAYLASYADATVAPFRLQADATYAHERRTAGAAVAYFLPTDTATLVNSDAQARKLIEAAVESLDAEKQRAACDAQLRQKQLATNEARRRPKGPEREQHVSAAEALLTPACDALKAKYGEKRSASEAFKAKVAEGALPHGAGHVWRVKTAAERSSETVQWTTTTGTDGAFPVVQTHAAAAAA
jgi:hypothetical protein